MGEPQEARIWHGISTPSISSGCGGGEEIWASGCMGPSMSSTPPLSGRGSEKACLLIITREDWPYAFMWLCKDSQHVPLSSYRHISQLEVCQLLQLEILVAYPKGLNGCLVPVVTYLPGSLAHGTSALNDEPTLLQVDLSQFTGEECEPWFLAELQHHLPPCISPWHIPPKWRATLAWPLQSASSCCEQYWTPPAKHQGIPPQKDQYLWPLGFHSLLGWKIPPSQWTPLLRHHHGWSQLMMQSRSTRPSKRFALPPPCQLRLWGPALVSSQNIVQLQKEVNKALDDLLMTRSSLDAHWRKQVSDFEMALHQNESEATEAIMEAKALCGSTIREAEAHCTTLIREAEAQHAILIREAVAQHDTLIREAEDNCASIITQMEVCCTTAIR